MNSNNQALAIKSVAKFLKLIAMMAFIRYELFSQQHLVLGRPKGLIYNKDGKFIYRPPKSNQGHIIVIDDRPRESSLLNYNSHPASMASPSSYHPYTLINHHQRMFQPDAISLANLVAPSLSRANGFGTLAASSSSGDHHQTNQQIHMISLNDLQNQHHFSPNAAALVAAAAVAAGAARRAQATALARSFPSPVMNPLLQVMQPARRFNNVEGFNYLDAARAKGIATPVGQQGLAELLAEQQASGMFGLDNQFNDQLANRNLIAHNRLMPFETDSSGAFELPTSMNFAESAFLDEPHLRSQLMLGKGRQGLSEFDHSSLLGATTIKEEDRQTKGAGSEDFFDEQIPGKLHNDNNINYNNGNNSAPNNLPNSVTNYRKPTLESNERSRKRSSNFKSKNNDGRSNKLIEAIAPPDTLLLRAGEDYQNKDARYWKQFRHQFDIVQ